MAEDFKLNDILSFLEDDEVAREAGLESAPGKFEHTPVKEEAEEVEEIEENEDEESVDEQLAVEEDSDDIEEVEETEDEESEESSDETGEIASGYFEFLKQNNVILVDDEFEFDGTPEKLEEAFNLTKANMAKQAIDALWGRLTPEFQAALKYNLDGGKDFKTFAQTFSDTLIDETPDLTDIEAQKKVVKEYYKLTSKYSDDKINRMIDRLIATDDLLEEAEDAFEYIKEEKEKQKEQLLEQQEKQRKSQEEAQSKWVETITSEINSSEIADSRKKKVQAFLLNPIQRGNVVATDLERVLGKILSEPKFAIQLGDLLLDFDEKQGLDLKRYLTKNKTQSTSTFQKELEEALSSSGKTKGGRAPKKKKNPGEQLDWQSILKQLDY